MRQGSQRTGDWREVHPPNPWAATQAPGTGRGETLGSASGQIPRGRAVAPSQPMHALPSTTARPAMTPAPVSRRRLLTWACAGAAGLCVTGLASLISGRSGPGAGPIDAHSSSAGGTQHADGIQTHKVVAARTWPAGYFHTLFSLNTPQEVEQAAALGVNFTICYGLASQASADPSTEMGQAMAHNGMRTFLNLLDFLTAHNGSVTLDPAGAAALVTRYKDSPLLAGYWIKDDDIGDERAAVVALRQLIRSLDPNPRHVIVAGFADANSVQQNYVHGMADALGFYPYPAFSRGPAVELPDMLRIVRARTPAGATPPPFMGIYQAFGTPPTRPVPSQSDVIAQVQTFVANGVAAIAGFGWEVSTESHAPANDASLRQAIQTVGDWLRLNGARLHGIGV